MSKNIIKFSGVDLAVNADMIAAVDVSFDEASKKDTVRIFFPGVSGGYYLNTPSKEVAEKLFETIVEQMKQGE